MITSKTQDTHPLKTFRDAKTWTQLRLAAFLGIDQSVVSRIESGEAFCSPKLAKHISRLTGIDRDRLMNFGESESDHAVSAPKVGSRKNR